MAGPFLWERRRSVQAKAAAMVARAANARAVGAVAPAAANKAGTNKSME